MDHPVENLPVGENGIATYFNRLTGRVGRFILDAVFSRPFAYFLFFLVIALAIKGTLTYTDQPPKDVYKVAVAGTALLIWGNLAGSIARRNWTTAALLTTVLVAVAYGLIFLFVFRVDAGDIGASSYDSWRMVLDVVQRVRERLEEEEEEDDHDHDHDGEGVGGGEPLYLAAVMAVVILEAFIAGRGNRHRRRQV